MDDIKGCLLIVLFLVGSKSDTHFVGTHKLVIYVTFAPSNPILPEYTSIGMLDDLQVFHYESNSREFVSPMKEKPSLSSVWTALSSCSDLKTLFFKEFLKQVNSTSGDFGNPVLQLMYGCELDSEENQKGIYKFSFNGKYVSTFDPDTMLWSSSVPQTMTFNKILSGFVIWNKNNMLYIKSDCIPRLKLFYEHGKTTVTRKVRPEVSIKARSGKQLTLRCVVTGFYPQDISVDWLQDGEIISTNVTTTGLLPNHDMTYQVQNAIEIEDKLNHRYSCRVQHSSLPEILFLPWDPPNEEVPIKLIWLAVGLLISGALVMIGIIRWRIRGREFAEVRQGQ